jgi:transcription antitermination factor NusG
MPILAAEVSLFPDNLLEGFSVAGLERRWWAVYTKARQEKSLARQLLAQEIPYYLPLIPKVSNIGGRRVKSLLPLFGGYLFMYGTEEERLQTLNTKRVAQMWPASKVDDVVGDLHKVRKLIDSGTPLTVEARMVAGQLVRVKSGAFMGMEGVIEKRRGEEHLFVKFNFIQQGVSVRISDYLLEPI